MQDFVLPIDFSQNFAQTAKLLFFFYNNVRLHNIKRSQFTDTALTVKRAYITNAPKAEYTYFIVRSSRRGYSKNILFLKHRFISVNLNLKTIICPLWNIFLSGPDFPCVFLQKKSRIPLPASRKITFQHNPAL